MASPLQIAGWVLDAGWSGADAVTATAVALRHGGDPAARGGLFGQGTAGSGAAQTDAAYVLWKGRSRDWNVFPGYRDRGYLLYIPVATPAVAAAAGKEAGEKVGSVIDEATGTVQKTVTGVSDTIETFGKIGSFLTQGDAWNRIIKVGVGVTVVAIGFAYLWKTQVGDRFLTGVGKVLGSGTEGVAVMERGVVPFVRGVRSARITFGRKVKTAVSDATPGPTPGPTPKPAPPPKRQPDDEPTIRLNTKTAEAHGTLGRYEAQSKGHAPFRGQATRTANPLPGVNAGTPKKGTRK